MTLKVQIRDENDNLLTEWIVVPKDSGSINVAAEIEWLRRPFGDDEGRTNAEALAIGAA